MAWRRTIQHSDPEAPGSASQARALAPPLWRGNAPLGNSANPGEGNTRPKGCQRSDTIGFPVFGMLRFLAVRHLAVIDELEVEFEPGLNVLTGETGAGKSILVHAIDLLVGGRASAELVRTGEDSATIQAIFERPDG